MNKYPCLIQGCKVVALKLSHKVVSCSPEIIVKRDKHFVTNQNITDSALVALSAAVDMLLTADEDME